MPFRIRPMVITDSFGNKSIEACKVLPICIAFDHRALDFGDIVPFLKRLDDIFENPKVIHTWKSSDKNNKGRSPRRLIFNFAPK